MTCNSQASNTSLATVSEYETYMMIVDEVEEMFPRLSGDEHLKKCCKTAFEITKVILQMMKSRFIKKKTT